MGPKLTELDGHGKIIYAVEVRDVLLSGAVVGVTASELRSPQSRFQVWLDLVLETDAHPDMGKTRRCKRTESIGVWDHKGLEVDTECDGNGRVSSLEVYDHGGLGSGRSRLYSSFHMSAIELVREHESLSLLSGTTAAVPSLNVTNRLLESIHDDSNVL
jgi:hypothetical protein